MRDCCRCGAVTLLLGFLAISFAWCEVGPGAGSEAVKIDREQARMLLAKGHQEYQQGLVDLAIISFEESYAANPRNYASLVALAEVYYDLGLFEQAFLTLQRIPDSGLKPAGYAHVQVMKAQALVASSTPELAVAYLQDARRTVPGHRAATIRLALIHWLHGRAAEVRSLLDELGTDATEETTGTDVRDLLRLMFLRLATARFSVAYQDCVALSAIAQAPGESGVAPADEEQHLSSGMFGGAGTMFLIAFPMALHGLAGLFYLLLLGGALVVVARLALPQPATWRPDTFFICACVAHLAVATWWAGNDVWHQLALNYSEPMSSLWILPRVLSSMNLFSLALLLIFPLLRWVSAIFRVSRAEGYAVWFFGWWFTMTVLVIQTNWESWVGLFWLVGCLLVTVVTAFRLPIGRLHLAQLGLLTGVPVWRYLPLVAARSAEAADLDEIDARILEIQVLDHMQQELFEQAVQIARLVLARFPGERLAALWQAMIMAQFEQENTFLLKGQCVAFTKALERSHPGQAQLINALEKSVTGDHSGALGVIQALPEQDAHNVAADDAAWFLWILGRAHTAWQDPVKAQIDFSSALKQARNPLLKAKILVELAELEVALERQEAVAEHLQCAEALSGGRKTASLLLLLRSMHAWVQGQHAEALELAKKATEACAKNSRTLYWYGKLLVTQGYRTQAEEVLQNMDAGTDDAMRLMRLII